MAKPCFVTIGTVTSALPGIDLLNYMLHSSVLRCD